MKAALFVLLLAFPAAAQIIDPTVYDVVISSEESRPVNVPAGIDVAGGKLTVTDAQPLGAVSQGRLRQLDLVTGVYLRDFAVGLNLPWANTTDLLGSVFATEVSANRVVRVVGGVLTPIAVGQAGPRGISRYGSGVAWANLDNNGANADTVMAYSSGTLTRLAGNGFWGASTDDVIATSSRLSNPYDVSEPDKNGAVYVSQLTGHKISRIDRAGSIKTIAGNGYAGLESIGDGSPARLTQLNQPTMLDIEAGDLWYIDQNNGRVRVVKRVDELGPSALAYTAMSGVYPRGMAVTPDYLYLAFAQPAEVRRYPRHGVTPAPATAVATATAPPPTATAVPPTATSTPIPATNTPKPTATAPPPTAPPATGTPTSLDLVRQIKALVGDLEQRLSQ